MKISQFKEKRKNKKLIIVVVAIVFLIGGIILDRAFANFKVQKSFKVMEGNFIYEGKGDIIFAFHNGNESLTQMPQKGNKENLIFEKGECDKGATVEWNTEKWAPLVVGLKENKTMCNLYFTKAPTINEYLKELSKTKANELIYDGKETLVKNGTDDNNLRFIGSNPNNYVEFNNETWRIIGVMNNIEDENGNIGSHLKIVRDSIGEYSWDSSPNNVNGGYGINEWSVSDIQKVLNENYYKKEAGGTCYGGSGNSTTLCPLWENIGLNDNARSMVSKVKWDISPTFGGGAIEAYYKDERSGVYEKCKGSSSYNNCNDDVNRTAKWPGYIGLPYPSDLGYATSGGTGKTRENCLNSTIAFWGNGAGSCYDNSWLMKSTGWTMTPNNNASGYTVIFSDNGNNLESQASGKDKITPVLYLNSNVAIIPSDDITYGSKTNPFKLS